jgi:hypothetical protein
MVRVFRLSLISSPEDFVCQGFRLNHAAHAFTTRRAA